MFYKIGEPHGLPHDPFKSCVVPRPIGWISTIGADGTVNLAPYSFFNPHFPSELDIRCPEMEILL